MDWHVTSGYGLLGLLVFRFLSGIFASDYGQFSRLPLGPRSVCLYVKGQRHFTGHNPLGSWMIVVMLLALLVQVASGLMTTDDIFVEGPWVIWAPEEWVGWAGQVHEINYWLLLALVAVHVLAIGFYRVVKKQSLIMPMITGSKIAAPDEEAATRVSLGRLALLIIVAVALTWLLVTI